MVAGKSRGNCSMDGRNDANQGDEHFMAAYAFSHADSGSEAKQMTGSDWKQGTSLNISRRAFESGCVGERYFA